MRRVVVTGVGVISPVGSDKETFWKSLVEGQSGIGRITAFDPAPFTSQIAGEVKGFDPLAHIGAKEAKRMERFVQFAVVAAKQAAQDCGLDLAKEDAFRMGTIVGCGIGSLHLVETEHSVYLEKGPARLTPFLIPMLIVNMAPGQVAIQLGLKGPNSCVATACASGSHAVGDAFRIIQRGDAEVMFAGGTEAAITPMGVGGFCALMALSRKRNATPEQASRPFDKDRDGFVIGEGSGIVVLEELEHAKQRRAKIYAEMVGYGMTGDAYHMTAPSPDGHGAAKAMETALKDAKLAPGGISYINAHGTSTELNDKIETLAIRKIFGPSAKTVAISSTKSHMGHLLGAAGGVEAVICALAIERQVAPPTINYEFPDPACDLDYIPNRARPMRITAVLSNSLGFGGHNATIIFKQYK
ncbi:MAG: beta-ketoacyl-ACP synthase II [Candidatus Omnitrophica bacterium]|nr:beta-ketoacyl-ACP synthase II [Candidatus Omnitrophota bacterium]